MYGSYCTEIVNERLDESRRYQPYAIEWAKLFSPVLLILLSLLLLLFLLLLDINIFITIIIIIIIISIICIIIIIVIIHPYYCVYEMSLSGVSWTPAVRVISESI